MRKDIKNVQTWVGEMVDNDESKRDLFESIDNMYHGDYALPKSLTDKNISAVISLVPHDALNAATKAYSGLAPKFRVKAMGGSAIEKDRARQLSTTIGWQFALADQRRRVLWDIVHSAMRYDAVAVRVDSIPFLYPDVKRAKKTRGMFDLQVYHPKYIHCEEGKFGIEKLALVTNHTLDNVITTWEKRKDVKEETVAKLREKLEDQEDIRFDLADATYWDGDDIWQTVFGNVTTSDDISDHFRAEYVLYHKKLTIPFIPWAVKYGGSNLETGDYSVHPLLAPLVWTDAWNDLNIKKSLLSDEVVKYAESPRRVNKTWNKEGVVVDYDHGSDINLNPQEDSAVQQPPTIDTALLQMVKDAEAEISNTTVASVLYQIANMAGTMPYATVSAVLQNTLSSLTPQKKLAENVIEQIACLFMEWTSYTKKYPLTAFRNEKFGDMPAGSDIVITPDDYDLGNLYISVELRSDNPMDEQQRVNMGILKNEKLKVPMADIHDELGYENPDERMEQWMEEKMDEVEFGKVITLSQAEVQLAIQQKQAAMQQSQAMQQPEGGEGFPSDAQGLSQAFDNTRGQGFNPNGGGATPMTAASPMGREQLTGQTMAGGPTVE